MRWSRWRWWKLRWWQKQGWLAKWQPAAFLVGTLVAGQADLRSSSSRSLGRHAWGNTGTSSWHLDMEHLGAAGSGEVEACRGGGVIEAEAEGILNNLAETGLLIYPRGLEEWQNSCFPESWAFESSAHRRPEELAEMHEGVVTYNAIAGKRCRSHLVYLGKCPCQACLATVIAEW